MFKQVKDTEILIFTKHLGVMLNAGIPIVDALSTLAKDAKSNEFKKILLDLKNQTSSGKTLSSAMMQYPHVFDDVYMNLIRIAEESGKLDTTLTYLSSELNKLYLLRKKIQGALMYPTLVISVMFAMGIALSIFVLPKLVDFFAAFDQQLPLATRILLGFASLMKDHSVLVIASIATFFITFNLLIKLRGIKNIWDKMIFSFPVFGNFFKTSKIAEIARNLSILVGSGVPLTVSLATLIHGQSNTFIAANLKILEVGLTKGKHLSDTIESANLSFFPGIFTKMLAVGERTGKLDEMFTYLAGYYDEEIETTSKNLTTLLEPILLVIVGLLVGFMAVAIISPIYQITGSIGG